MATLRVTVQIGGSGPLADTEANRRRIFTITGGVENSRVRFSTSSSAYDLNAPKIPGTLSVTSFSPAQFDSAALTGESSVVDQLAYLIEGGYLEVVDEAAPGVPLTRANLEAFL